MACLGAALWAAAGAAYAAPAAAASALPVWVVPGDAKIFPGTPPGPVTTVDLSAAAGEYEAVQVAVALTAPASVTLVWRDGDPLLTAADLFHVGYVNVRDPSTGVGAPPGMYPDPLLPAAFGVPVTLPPGSSSFYLRVFVPASTPAGDYHATLELHGPGATVALPVSLHVWDVGWQRPSLHTAFALSIDSIMRSVAGALPDTPENEALLADKYYRFFAQHWISPTGLRPRPIVDRATGAFETAALTGALTPYLGTPPGPGSTPGVIWDTSYPLSAHFPWGALADHVGTPELETYVRELLSYYRANGWDRRAYFYVYDEPSLASEMAAEKVAQVAHRISQDELGFRARFMLTDWPRPTAVGGRSANGFLFDDVDVWCPSVYRYFLAQNALDARRADGADVWWYTYASRGSEHTPTFLIDETLAEERGFAWMAWRYGASGILYWGTTRWGDATTADGYRDPYLDPVSFASRHGWHVNGEACLIYPGYEPALGLMDPTAGPVSSLRFEALRDGLEDHELLRLAARLRTDDPGGVGGLAAAAAARVAQAMSDYPYGPHGDDYRNMPVFSTDPAMYAAARQHLASYIERAQQGVAPAVGGGVVVDVATGAPLASATVSDGVVQTLTDAGGAFTLSGVLPDAHLTVTQPLYGAARVEAREGDAPLRVALARLPSAELISSFETKALFRVAGGSGGYTQSATDWASQGTHSARIVLRGPGAAATLSLPPQARDLHRQTSLELDLYDPAPADHENPWFLWVTVVDRRGHTIAQRFLPRPQGLTHISLPLTVPGFDRAHTASLRLSVFPSGNRTFYVDALAVK